MFLSILATGCSVAPVAYIDQKYHDADYKDIKQVQTKHKVSINSTFQRNGENLPNLNPEVQKNAERVLRAIGVAEIAQLSDVVINIIVNNIYDKAGSFAKGFGTGLTFGAVGSTVVDHYEISISMTVNGKEVSNKKYEHNIFSTVGNTSAPNNARKTTTGFADVMEDTLLNFVRDMQLQGLLAVNKLSKASA